MIASTPDPCPKCGYVRQPGDTCLPGECQSCGVIFEKYFRRQVRFIDSTRILEAPHLPPPPSARERLATLMLDTPERPDVVLVWGRALVYAGSVAWGLWFIVQPWRDGAVMGSFLHNVDLPFHEFGHVLFRPLGHWMMLLGGSLFQCLLPLLLAGYFLFRQRQPFAASICLWWCGQNFIDLAPYIGDARALELPLTGEWNEDVVELRPERHDWHNLLAPLGLLPYDHRLAKLSKFFGALMMLAAWIWGGLLLQHQAKTLERFNNGQA